MEYGTFVAAAIGFAPAIILMLWTLQPYTYPKVERPYFSDPTLFGMFAGGIIIGVILHAVGVLFSAYYILVAFILEEAIKLVVLNLPRYQRRADVPFYGFGLGAGMASALAYGAINATLTNTDPTVLSILIIAIYSIMLSLLHISTGTTIGIGVARGQPFVYFGQAVIIHLAFALLLVPFQQIAVSGTDILAFILFIVATIFILTYYYYLHYRLLPIYVKEALKELQRRKSKSNSDGKEVGKKIPRTKH